MSYEHTEMRFEGAGVPLGLLLWFCLTGPLGAQIIQEVYEPHLTITRRLFVDQTGNSVAWAGDVNRDGLTDLIVGAPGRDSFGMDSGTVSLYSGKDAALLWEAHGMPGDGLGWSVAGAGDVNADGYPDVIAGACSAKEDAGSAFVYSGRDGSLLWRFDGSRGTGQHLGELLGMGVAGPGDVNQDGFSDLLVSAPFAGQKRLGISYVYSGKDGSTIWEFGSRQIKTLGWPVAGAGDVDLDGFPDLLVGTRGVYSGRDGSMLVRNSEGIRAVAGAGDVNRDGIPDFIVSTSLQASSAAVFSGKNGSMLWRFFGVFTDQFGWAVAGAGDVDLDGFPDLLVGAPRAVNAQGIQVGAVYTYSGKTGAVLMRLEGQNEDDRFGNGVAGGGNLNGDFFPDVLVGAPETDYFGTTSAVKAGYAATYLTRVSLAKLGTAVPGSGNIAPIIGTAGDIPRLGNSSFRIEVTRAMGGAPVLIAASTAKAVTMLEGLTLYGDFLTPSAVWTWSMLASGIPAILANGTATLAVPIPQDATLLGLQTYWQGFVLDPGSPLPIGVSHTRGLEVRVVR